jgi:hypothetical protein
MVYPLLLVVLLLVVLLGQITADIDPASFIRESARAELVEAQ